jgi:WD40 repeat protein
MLWARQDRLELWDLDGGRRLALLPGHSDEVNAVAFNRDGTRAFSCARDIAA